MSATGCYECSQKNGHAATGGKHMPFHCKRDLCPDKAKHYEQVYAGRITARYGSNTRDGVMTYVYIDGKKAETHYRQERCICGLYLIYTPKSGTSPLSAAKLSTADNDQSPTSDVGPSVPTSNQTGPSLGGSDD